MSQTQVIDILKSQFSRAVPVLVCGLLLVAVVPVAAQDEALSESWRVVQPVSPLVQIRTGENKTTGEKGHQSFRAVSLRDFQTVKFELEKTPALVIDDFKATLSVQAPDHTLQFGLRVVVPGQKDPRTGRPLVTNIMGNQQESVDGWQHFSAQIPRSVLDAKARELRAELKRPDISMNGAYVNGCVLTAELHKGVTEIHIGACKYGPVVAPRNIASTDAGHRETGSAPQARITIDRDKVLFQGRPLFPRFIPDHGESAKLLNQLGVNMVWLPDLGATPRMRHLIDTNLLVMATPPHPEFDPADFNSPLEGLPPLDQTSPLPDIWYLGTAIRSKQLPHLLAWSREVRSADRVLRRPLMADLMESEGVASRLVDSVGISQHSISNFMSFGEARNRSFVRQNASAQLTLPWEWIQTEHSTSYSNWRQRIGGSAAFVEPEQILMQLVACLSAGSRGVGFWKTRQMNTGVSADAETATAIELANLYIQILEPLLIRGQVDGHIPIDLDDKRGKSSKGSLLTSVIGSAPVSATNYLTPPEGPDAAVLNAPGTSLILAGFWDSASQFVPQQMFAPTATLTVSATETSSAWKITPTSVRGYRRQPAPGGLQLNLTDFDQFSIALVTADLDERRRMEERVQKHAKRAARLFVRLAKMKLARVQRKTSEIDDLVGRDDKAVSILSAAGGQIQYAEQAIQQRSFPSAEKYAKAAMRGIRTVQNRYWYRAIQTLPTPTASPHSVSFSTLHDHWQMMKQVEAGIPSSDLMPSGDFEQTGLLSGGTWKPVVTQPESFHAGAEIVSERAGTNNILRMRAWDRAKSTSIPSAKPALLIQCPEVMVEKGDILEISARVRAGLGVRKTQATPFLVFDSDLGPELAVAPRLEPSWRTFRMYRQVSASGPFKLWLGLQSPAEVYVDNIRVVRRAKGASLTNSRPESLTTDSVDPKGTRSRVQGAGYSNPSLP